MKAHIIRIWLVPLLALLVPAFVASVAETTADEQLNWQVLSGGGTRATTTNHQLGGTIQQTAVGKGASTNYRVSHGYWQSFVIWIPFEAEITVHPRVLNLQSRGRWISAFIEPSPPYTPEDVILSSVLLQEAIPAEPDRWSIEDSDEDGIMELKVNFDRALFQEIIPEGEHITVTVSGTAAGRRFMGEDVIRTIRPKVTHPDGGVILAGEITSVTWTSPEGYNIDYADVHWTHDDGESWECIACGIPNTGSVEWSAPDAQYDSCRVMVTIYSAGEDLGMAMSQEMFTISYQIGIALVDFAGSIENGAAILRWRTMVERRIEGFHILRSEDTDGDYQRITSEMIPSMGPTSGSSYQYIDDAIVPNRTYYYMLEAVSGSGPGQLLGPCRLSHTAVFVLQQNVPNPFNPATTIRFSIKERAHAILSVFDVQGRLITTLIDEQLSPGFREIVWNGIDAQGNSVASGIYFYRLTAGKQMQTRKMLLLR